MNINELRKKYGVKESEFVRTFKGLDDLLTGGLGFPLGSVIEFASEPGVGKSTLSLQIAKIFMNVYGYKVLYLDVERALTGSLLGSMGIDGSLDNFIHLCPLTFSDLDEILSDLPSLGVKLVILDSITAVLPDRREENKDAVSLMPGVKSLSQSTFIEYYRPKFIKGGVTLLLINQLRSYFNFRNMGYLDSSGSISLKFASDVRCSLSVLKMLKGEGYELEILTVKNKYTKPRQSKKFVFNYGTGVDVLRSYADDLIDNGVIVQSGSYFKVGDKSVQGYKGLLDYLGDNLDLLPIDEMYLNVLKLL